MVASLILVGVGGALWEVRVASSATPLALLGGVWAFVRLARAPIEGRGERFRLLLACCALLVSSPMAWAIVPTPDEAAAVSEAAARAQDCRDAGHVTPLAALTPGLVFAPIDSGSHLLVHTPLSAIGAPYHRDNHGNRAVIDGFSATGSDAERIVKNTGARYVAICPGQVQAAALVERSPDGLAAQILAGRAPAWLEQLDVKGTPYRVFAVR